MSVLAAPVSLGDPRRVGGAIDDVEALVNKVIEDRMRHWPRGRKTLDDHKRQDLVSYLIGVAWELSGRYDPKRDGKKPNLAAYVARILNLRIADWFRQAFGDTRHGDRPVVLSLDAPASLGESENSDGSERLVDTLASSTGDPAVDRSPDLVGVLHGRDRGVARAHDSVGEQTARRAARGDRGAANPPRVGSGARITKTRRPFAGPPVCEHCYRTFLRAFTKVNGKIELPFQLSPAQVEEKARRRARAVRFGTEWACPRCTRLHDKEGNELMLAQAYPNRSARRAAHGNGVAKDRAGAAKKAAHARGVAKAAAKAKAPKKSPKR